MIKILVMEDDELFCETLEDFLSTLGFDITTANDGDSASDLCYERSFDLLLLDVNVPKQNGFELLKSLRDTQQNVPAIFITSFADKDSIKKGFLSGGDDYLTKPIDLDELKLRIFALLKRTNKLQNRLSIKGKEYIADKGVLGQKQLSHKVKLLFDLLLENQNKIVSKELIFQKVWEWDERPSEASLRVYINDIKKILGKDSITNHKGVGYRLEL
jgi:DNA-binding response OmpR family regulator